MMTSPPPIDLLHRIERETFVRRVEWHAEIDSTNSYALSLAARNELELPRVIWTDRQTAGRGRGQNSWWSADGALLLSLLINPLEFGLSFSRWPQVALTTGLAVADTLERYVPATSVQLKWPNDVYASGRKICGILTEVPPHRTDRLVVGVGLNVANSLREASSELQAGAVSLADLLCEECPSPGEVLLALLRNWERWLKRLAAGEIDFPRIWQTKCYLTGADVAVAQGEEIQTGRCLGLDADGALLLETPAGPQRILAGTVRRLSS